MFRCRYLLQHIYIYYDIRLIGRNGTWRGWPYKDLAAGTINSVSFASLFSMQASRALWQARCDEAMRNVYKQKQLRVASTWPDKREGFIHYRFPCWRLDNNNLLIGVFCIDRQTWGKRAIFSWRLSLSLSVCFVESFRRNPPAAKDESTHSTQPIPPVQQDPLRKREKKYSLWRNVRPLSRFSQSAITSRLALLSSSMLGGEEKTSCATSWKEKQMLSSFGSYSDCCRDFVASFFFI